MAHFHLASAFTHLLLASKVEWLPSCFYLLHFSSSHPPPPPGCRRGPGGGTRGEGLTPYGDATLRRRSQRGYQLGLQEVRYEGDIQVRTDKVKDTLPVEKQSKVVYQIPCRSTLERR